MHTYAPPQRNVLPLHLRAAGTGLPLRGIGIAAAAAAAERSGADTRNMELVLLQLVLLLMHLLIYGVACCWNAADWLWRVLLDCCAGCCIIALTRNAADIAGRRIGQLRLTDGCCWLRLYCMLLLELTDDGCCWRCWSGSWLAAAGVAGRRSSGNGWSALVCAGSTDGWMRRWQHQCCAAAGAGLHGLHAGCWMQHAASSSAADGVGAAGGLLAAAAAAGRMALDCGTVLTGQLLTDCWC